MMAQITLCVEACYVVLSEVVEDANGSAKGRDGLDEALVLHYMIHWGKSGGRGE